MSETPPLTPGLRAHLDEGLRRFNAGLFWEAHEAWEEAWLATDGDLKLWFQGLIQLTAALHKGLRMGSSSGMARLLEQAEEKLSHTLATGGAPAGLDTSGALSLARDGRQRALDWAAGGPRPWSKEPLPQLDFPMDPAGNPKG